MFHKIPLVRSRLPNTSKMPDEGVGFSGIVSHAPKRLQVGDETRCTNMRRLPCTFGFGVVFATACYIIGIGNNLPILKIMRSENYWIHGAHGLVGGLHGLL